jgi:P4 family phage/plasmid primase-like protien
MAKQGENKTPVSDQLTGARAGAGKPGHTTQYIPLELAQAYLQAGLSVIPAGPDKRPLFKWEPFQTKRATEKQLSIWFADGGNLAIICGAISGGLLVLDFDSAEIWQRFCRDHLVLIEGLPVVRTGKGYHVYLRCAEPGGNHKLAVVAGVKVIETRGEGGYVLAPGSIHPETKKTYELIRGDLSNIPTLEMPQVAQLLEACRSYDDTPKKSAAPAMVAQPATNRARRYALSALVSESEKVRNAADGDRNNQLNRSGFVMAQLVAGGELSRGDVEGVLAAAARARGLGDGEILPTLASAFDKGMLQPRTVPAQPTNGHQRPHAENHAQARASADDDEDGDGPRKVTRDEVAEYLIVRWRGETLNDTKADRWRRWSRQAWLEVPLQALLSEAKQAALDLGASKSMITSAAIEDILKMCTWPEDMRRNIWNTGTGVYFANGRLDLDAQTFESHTPSNFNTAVLPYDWQPNASCPLWQAHIKRTIPDVAGRRALAEHLALTLAGDTGFHKAIVLMGPPRSGKSVVAEVARAALGDFAAETSAMLFRENDSESGKRAIRLRHCRLVTIDELPPDTLESDSIFKRMAGHGLVEARGMYADADEFRWRAKFLFSTNVAPRIFDRSGAVAARLLFIECPNSLLKTPKLMNLRLAREIIADELAGVAAWALSAYPELLERKAYSESQAMLETNEKVVLDSDPLQVFLEECCNIGADLYAEAPLLYKAWKAWALENGYQPGSRVTFKHNLEASHLASQGKHPVTRRIVWNGLGLLSKDAEKA